MQEWIIILAVCGLYLAVVLVAGLIPGRFVSKSATGFVAADRTMNVVVLFFILGAAVFSSFAFLGGPGWAYSRGAASFYIIAYMTVGIVPLYFFGPRTYRLGERFGFVTQAELLAHRYNSDALSILLAVLSVTAFLPYLTLQMKGVGYILSTVSSGHIPMWLGALIPYVIVLGYVSMSGVMGVGWTNVIQGIFMVSIAWFLGLYLSYQLYGGVGAMFEKIISQEGVQMLEAPGLASDGSKWNWWSYSSAVLVSAFGFTMWPHLFMKSYAARSVKSLRLTVVLYPLFQFCLVPVLLIGFAGVVAFSNVKPADTIVPFLLTQLDLSPVLVGLVSAGVLAASMSTGDTILHAAASIGIRDGLQPVISGGMNDEQERLGIRVLVVAISILAYYFAVISDVSIVALLLGAYGGVAQIFPLVFAAFYWPKSTRAGAVAGLGVGLSVNTICLLFPAIRPLPLHEGLYGLVANVLVFALVNVFAEPEPEDKVRAYINSGTAGRKEVAKVES